MSTYLHREGKEGGKEKIKNKRLCVNNPKIWIREYMGHDLLFYTFFWQIWKYIRVKNNSRNYL